MPELYRRARALVMPLEAFEIGCPVAISGIYAMPEQAGDAALLFNPESVDEMLSASGSCGWTMSCAQDWPPEEGNAHPNGDSTSSTSGYGK
jgi:hypothetical protein